jgi:hypothetical protein
MIRLSTTASVGELIILYIETLTRNCSNCAPVDNGFKGPDGSADLMHISLITQYNTFGNIFYNKCSYPILT